MRVRGAAAWVAAAMTAAGTGPSAAEQPLWELGIGVGALHLPHYRGSDQAHTWLLPVPYVVYRGEIFKADREGARAVLFDSERIDFDLSAALSPPTRSEDNRAREGMDDLPPVLELGPNLNWTLARAKRWKLDLRLPVRAALGLGSGGGSLGWVAAPNLNLDLAAAGGWQLGLQLGAPWHSRRYNAHYYGVGPEDVRADRPAYEAREGSGGAQLTAAASRRSGRHWSGAFVRFDTLRSASFDSSPLVRQRQQWSVGFAYSWILSSSSRTVPSAD